MFVVVVFLLLFFVLKKIKESKKGKKRSENNNNKNAYILMSVDCIGKWVWKKRKKNAVDILNIYTGALAQ